MGQIEALNGVLYHLWENATGRKIIKQLVVPKNLGPSVVHLLHNLPTYGHMGVARIIRRVKKEDFIVCLQRYAKLVQELMHVLLDVVHLRIWAQHAQYNIGSQMELVVTKVLGPLPTSEDGNKYLLITVRYFTKWVEGHVLPNQEATTVADLEDFVTLVLHV